MSASPAERTLNAYSDSIHKTWFRRGFTEDGEMNDAYNVQNCHAVAGEITTLASTRLDPGVNHLSSRILPEPLAVFPVMAATGTDDAQWSSIVAWTVHTLVARRGRKPGGIWEARGQCRSLQMSWVWTRTGSAVF